MKIYTRGDTACFAGVTSLDLDSTFNCGQCFRWDSYENGYRGFANDVLCHVFYDGDILCVRRLTPVNDMDAFADMMYHYLALDTDYDSLKAKFSSDEMMKKAISYAEGIRVLKQPFFETLITFIISQNNNIPRIKKIVDALSEKYGTKIGDVYAFPTREQLKDVTIDDYARLRVGFRAKYLYDTLQKINSGEITYDEITKMDTDTARDYLMKIKGVGPKVADCVLLFSCEKYDCLPKDVWIKRALREMFPDGIPDCIKGYEGIAQQYIFQYARFNIEK